MHSYPKIHNVGHPEIMTIFDDDVVVEEKVDGSAINFSVNEAGDLEIRSKGAAIHVDAPEKMFAEGVDEILAIKHLLTPGYVYRGEYLKKPKHNALAYSRIPNHHIVIFDVEISPDNFMPWSMKQTEALRLGLECVPIHFVCKITSHDQFKELLEKEFLL